MFAAASLKTALDEVASEFEQETGQGITVSYAASSVLARQIQLGAPADLFISANVDWMNVLQDQGLIDPTTRIDLLSNGLVLVAGGEGVDIGEMRPGVALASALNGGYLAMALVDAVPAGVYGKAALESLGLWQGIQGQIAQTDNVRSALALVATGAAPMGIVYRSDAQVEGRVRVIAEFSPDLHPPIIYPVALTAVGAESARVFLNHLQSQAARAVFEKQGFTLPNG
ncbi:Molybdate-binding periplasmic protein precursor [Ruegeria atlantica]|uniref:Molybdate-binding protein ModA n=1 Tax=Ruegeria atlantica TaxID=81569 RepID=A0A0P1ELG3_9RHOB|nr:Molybdate-binding periplasmic protein precursor [Ruegeria atlantica]